MYTLLLCIIYLAFISLGLPDSLLGAAWPSIYPALNVPISSMGVISMIISGGTIISSLLSERLIRTLHTQLVTLISVLLTAAALFGFSASTEFWMLCVWAVPYGLGAGAIDSSLNNYVALHYSSRHMSWLHCFWGVGTIVSPCIMGWALANRSWMAGYRIVAVIQLSIALVLLLTLPVWKRQPGSRAQGASESGKALLGLRGAVRIPGVPSLLASFFCYCAAENSTMLWMSSYLVGARGVSAQQAASFASLFFIGMTVGRFVSGLISDRLGDRKMITLGTCIALGGVAVVLLPLASAGLALAGFLIFGLGCAPIYPAIIHSTPANFGAENTQAIIGIQMAAAYLGSTLMPPLFGVLSGVLTMRLLPFWQAGFLAAMTLLLRATYRRADAVHQI